MTRTQKRLRFRAQRAWRNLCAAQRLRVKHFLCDRQSKVMHDADMDEPHHRLRQARINAGFKSAADAARRLGVPYGTYSGHENGGRRMQTEEIIRYSKIYNVSPTWIMIGREDDYKQHAGLQSMLIWKLGDVGKLADGEIDLTHPKDDVQFWPKMNYVPDNSSYIDVVGFQAKSFVRPYWKIICQDKFYPAHKNQVGMLCACKEEGRAYLRIMRKFNENDKIEFETPLGEIETRSLDTTICLIGIIVPPAGIFATTKVMRELADVFSEAADLAREGGPDRTVRSIAVPFGFDWDAYKRLDRE